MEWINQYQLFLFDFDGLLVNTEELHFFAYKKMCALHGFKLDWDFDTYCQAAHYSAEALRDQIYGQFPELKAQFPDWKVLYAEKKQALMDLVANGTVHLMPGAERLLKALEKANIKRCVVTHSPDDLVNAIRRQIPILDTIPDWITRHDYTHPKPHPECYIKAIEKFAHNGDRIIGFEDTPRGVKALMPTQAQAVMISRVRYPEIPMFMKHGVLHYPSLDAISEKIGN